jgi:redoxin
MQAIGRARAAKLDGVCRLAGGLTLLASSALACAPAAASRAAAPTVPGPVAARPARPAQPVGMTSCPSLPARATGLPAHAIAPDERVPDFLLATQACDVLDSRELVGKVPFVVVFFASWCSVCEQKVPQLREALARRSEVTPLWVSLDEAGDGWSATNDFLGRHALSPGSAVAGQQFLEFSFGYNPFRSVPVVVVVGRSGRVVTVQIGVRDGDEAELEQALDLAIDEPPEQTRLTSFRPP